MVETLSVFFPRLSHHAVGEESILNFSVCVDDRNSQLQGNSVLAHLNSELDSPDSPAPVLQSGGEEQVGEGQTYINTNTAI